MWNFPFTIFIALNLLPAALGGQTFPAQTYHNCQRITPNPLQGCPHRTLFVSQTDHRAHFKSIQAAIHSLPNDTSSHVILIGAGTYVEQLNVTRSGSLTLLGQSNRPWKGESYGDIDVNTTAQNDVQIYWNAANHDKVFPDNVYTGVLTVGPTYNATITGAGPTGYPVPPDTPFGCSDFRAYNIDFRNEFAPYADGPAHAVGLSYANAGFYSCGLYSYQDTLYVGKLGNAYFYDNVIAGQVDFLYGFGTAFIEKTTLSLRRCGGGITAWKGTNTTFDNKYGVYIADSQIIAANSSIADAIRGKCSLGRPWNSLHRSVYMNTYFDPSILPAGYTTWSGAPNNNFNNGTLMAVYNVYGPGFNRTAEVNGNVTKILDRKEVASYERPIDVFMTPTGKKPNVAWLDPVALQTRRW